jgi:V/A-type H+-transporting ATPase subunit C
MFFAKAYDAPDDHVLSAALPSDYRRIMAAAFAEYQKTGSLYMLEKARDDYLLAMLEKARNDMFGIGPLMGYYIAKQREAAAVRMVMTAKLGGISAETVAARIKELY